MAMLRLLTALVALVLILAQPREAAAGTGDCDSGWDDRVEVFACGPYEDMRDEECRQRALSDPSTEGCEICADRCQEGPDGWYYWCRAQSHCPT
jgi:hypothetical protein